MGVGKSSCQDVCMYHLCGYKEVAKIDSDTRNSTVKRLAALKTFPTCIEVSIFLMNYRYYACTLMNDICYCRTTLVLAKKKI